jgi:catechol 2,3-dioxygenase-like lactoylglutathione lyase family enzyme
LGVGEPPRQIPRDESKYNQSCVPFAPAPVLPAERTTTTWQRQSTGGIRLSLPGEVGPTVARPIRGPRPIVMGEESPVALQSCIPVIPSADLEKSLRFWVEGLGLTVDREMRNEGKLIGCMVHNGDNLYFWLNQRGGTPVEPGGYEGIRLYWAPSDLHETRERLKRLGYAVSDIEERAYGQTEFFVTDDDGFSHCFGVATKA